MSVGAKAVRGLAGARVAGKEEVAVGLVPRPPKARERDYDLPPVSDDFAGRVTHPAPMIGKVESQSRGHAMGGPDDKIIRSRQTPRAKYPGSDNDQSEWQRTRSA